MCYIVDREEDERDPMIKDCELLRKFEDDLIASSPLSYEAAMKLLESMYREAIALGVYPPADPLEGIEEKIELARVLHGCSKK